MVDTLTEAPSKSFDPTSCDVKIEEITVKDGLHHSRHHGDLVEEALCVITPHPVSDIEGAVKPEEEQVVGSDGLRFPGFGDHEELRHDGHCLQEDGEGPQDLGGTIRKERVKLQTLKVTTKLSSDKALRRVKFEDSVSSCLYLHRSESIVFQEGKPDDRHQQELHSERVVCRVERVLEANVDQVHGGIGQSQEDHLQTEPDGNHTLLVGHPGHVSHGTAELAVPCYNCEAH